MRTSRSDREERFRTLYAGTCAEVLRFAQRRVPPGHAEDVAAEAFLVAWRRFDEAPRHADDVRAWLFGIARHCLLNTRRGIGRQDALAVRIAGTTRPDGDTVGEDEAAAQRLDLAAAWRCLSAGEQETLALTVFDGLTSPQAARVLGTTAATYRLRLLRARRALRGHLDRAGTGGSDPLAVPGPTSRMENRP